MILFLSLFLLFRFFVSVGAAYTCHSDCKTGLCHGPTEFNCDECATNMVLKYNQCVCKVGYFDKNGKCDFYKAFCLKLSTVGGVAKCLKCESVHDTLTNGECTRDLTTPAFLRPGSGAFDGRNPAHVQDAVYFFDSSCKSLNSAGECAECYEGAVLQASGICQKVYNECDELDNTGNKCIRTIPWMYLKTPGTNQFQTCFQGCKSCIGGSYSECQSCIERYYFEPFKNKKIGWCKPCHSSCRTCTGPSETECSTTFPGQYIEKADPTNMNKVKSCPSNCLDCDSATNCIRCKFEKISIDGVCSTSRSNIQFCDYQYRESGVDRCVKYNPICITTTDNKCLPVLANSINQLNSVCYEFNTDSTTGYQTTDCKTCLGVYNVLENGICKSVARTSPIEFCQTITPVTPRLIFCTSCEASRTLSVNKVCETSCTGSSAMLHQGGRNFCSTCTIGCERCEFQSLKYVCLECFKTPKLFMEQNNLCSTTVCGDGLITDNKECDIAIPEQASFCTPDCMKIDPLECTGLNCVRKVFELVSDPEIKDQMQLRITPRYQDYVVFTIKAKAVYDDTDSNNKKVFCSMVIPDLEDSTSTCTFIKDKQIVSISTRPDVIHEWSKKTTSSIHAESISHQRKFLNELAFSLQETIEVKVVASSAKSALLVTTERQWNLDKDFHMTYVLTEWGVPVLNSKWSITGLTVDSVSAESKRTQINSVLTSGNNIIPKNLLADKLWFQYSLTVTYKNGITETKTGETFIMAKNLNLKLIGKNSVVFYDQEPSDLLFEYTTNAFDSSLLIINDGTNNLPANDFKVKIFEETKRVMVTISPSGRGSSFKLSFSYNEGTYISQTVYFSQAKPYPFANFIVPRIFGVGQSLTFFTSFGNDTKFKAFVFSKSTGAKIFGSSEKTSNYFNDIGQGVGSTQEVQLYLMLTKAGTESIIHRFDLKIEGASLDYPANILLKTTYRDGSILQQSSNSLSVGVQSQEIISSLSSTSFSAKIGTLSTQSSSGPSTKELYLTPSIDNKNKLLIGDPLNQEISSTEGHPIQASFDYEFLSTQNNILKYSCKMMLFNWKDLQTVVKQVGTPDGSNEYTFEVQSFSQQLSSIDAAPNKYLTYSPSQYHFDLYLKYALPSSFTRNIPAVVLTDFMKYGLIQLPGFVVKPDQNSDIRAKAQIAVFNFNAFHKGALVNISEENGATVASQNFDDYLTKEIQKISSFSSSSDLKSYLAASNPILFSINQLYLLCKYDSQCSQYSLGQAMPLRKKISETFFSIWDPISDKYAAQDWHSSVLKSSLLNSLTLDTKNFEDSLIVSLDQEISREVNQTFQKVLEHKDSLGRQEYELIERLKGVQTITLENVNQEISALSHDLRMFSTTYKGFSSAESTQTKLNSVYKKILGMNEIRLLRYTHPTDQVEFQNEMMSLGGVTLPSPLKDSYVFYFQDAVAVEFKNLKFEKDLDDYNEELNERLQEFNLTSTLNKSRTSIGFTSEFELVNPKIESDSEINIYRKKSECFGKPCDPTRKLIHGEEIILCQCLRPDDANKFTEPKKESPKSGKPSIPGETGEVISDTLKGVGTVIKGGAFADPKSLSNYRIWINSIIVASIVLTLLLIIALALETKVIDPRAKTVAASNALSILVSEVLLVIATIKFSSVTSRRHSSRLRTSSRRRKETSPDSPSTSADSQEPLNPNLKKLEANQAKIFTVLNEHLETNSPNYISGPGPLKKAVKKCVFKALSFGKLFWIVYSTHHYIGSIFTTNASNYSRKSMLVMVYAHTIYVLALTTYLTMGLEKDDFSSYKRFVLKCFISPILISGVFFVIKKLVKNEQKYNMHILKWCPKKKEAKTGKDDKKKGSKKSEKENHSSSIEKSGSVAPVRAPKGGSTFTESIKHKRKESEGATMLASGSEGPDSPQSRLASPLHRRNTLPEVKIEVNPQKTPEFKKSGLGKAFIIVGYVILLILIPASIFLIYSITILRLADNSSVWPFGYWFVLQMVYDMSIGQIPVSFFQYLLMKCQIKGQRTKSGFSGCISRHNCLLNTDLVEITKLSSSLRVLPSGRA